MSDERPWTVGDLRAAMKDCDDGDQIVVMVYGGEDRAIERAFGSYLIPWEHDCTDWDDDHKAGRDCPTVWSLEIHVDQISEFPEPAAPASPVSSVSGVSS